MKIRFLKSDGSLIPKTWAKFLQIEYEFDEPFEVLPAASPTERVAEYEIITKANDGKIKIKLDVPAFEKIVKTNEDIEITIPDVLVDRIKAFLAMIK